MPLVSVSLKALCAYDEAVFGATRVAFLQAWVEQGDACALGVLRDGGLVGYGVVRRCRVGSKIGPLFADDADTAERLFNALSAGDASAAPQCRHALASVQRCKCVPQHNLPFHREGTGPKCLLLIS